MLSDPILSLEKVWKKYSRDAVFHRSLREDFLNIFNRPSGVGLKENDFWALQDVTFTLRTGEAIGLYGHNGAGKSTILKLLSGVTHPTSGTIKVNGRIAPLIEIGAGFHPDLTGRENIFINGAILGMRIPEIKRKYNSIVDFSELGDFIQMPVKKYSSGMYLRLAFSIAIHSDADVYLIDEILAVGDVSFQDKCLERIRGLMSSKKSLVVVSHDIRLLKTLMHKVIYLEHGKVSDVEIIS